MCDDELGWVRLTMDRLPGHDMGWNICRVILMEHHKACARCRQYLRICRVCLLGRPCSICRHHHAGCVLSLCLYIFFSHGSVSFLASGLHRFVQFGHQRSFPMQRLSDIFVCGLILCVSKAEARSLFELLVHVGSEVETSGEKSVT